MGIPRSFTYCQGRSLWWKIRFAFGLLFLVGKATVLPFVLAAFLVLSSAAYVMHAQDLAEQLANQREINAAQQEYINQLKAARIVDRQTIQEVEVGNLKGNARTLIGLLISLNGIALSVGGFLIKASRKVTHAVRALERMNNRLDGLEIVISSLACQKNHCPEPSSPIPNLPPLEESL
jgi:hypothetical protein